MDINSRASNRASAKRRSRMKIPQCGTFDGELEKLHPDNSDSHREQAGT
jgi:hypothetical protein